MKVKTAAALGADAALEFYGLKSAGVISNGVGLLGQGLKWGGRAIGAVGGNVVGSAVAGAGGMAQGFANGEGWKGMAARGAMNAGTAWMPGGAGIAAGVAGDMALNRAFRKSPTSIGQVR